MELLIASYLFVIGLAFGSFALAMVDRMKSGKDWVRGRSECEYCKHVLAPKDLVPLLSWLVQNGKCRYCRKKLSKSYPLVEFVTGLAFAASYVWFPVEISGYGILLLALWLVGLVIMAGLFVFDMRWFMLPSKLVYPLIFVATIYRVVTIASGGTSVQHELIATLGALAVSAGFFAVLHAISRGKWIGDGDVRLGVAMGLFLNGPVESWLAIFVASLAGVVLALPQLMTNKKALKMKVPYGPMLILGLVIAFLFGGQIIDWYSSTFLYY